MLLYLAMLLSTVIKWLFPQTALTDWCLYVYLRRLPLRDRNRGFDYDLHEFRASKG
jgi:hypothetical protein